MPSTTVYKKWDVILVTFPFTDFTADKRRPALVVSPDSFNTGHDVTIAFVTKPAEHAGKSRRPPVKTLEGSRTAKAVNDSNEICDD